MLPKEEGSQNIDEKADDHEHPFSKYSKNYLFLSNISTNLTDTFLV